MMNTSLRIMTYNTHHCLGMDRRLNVDRIVNVIDAHQPDIVGLQEMDNNRKRSQHQHQTEYIAKKLDYHFFYAPAKQVGDEQFGNAILSKYPMDLVHADILPGMVTRPKIQHRSALWANIHFSQDVNIQFFNTHLGLYNRERINQVGALLGPKWLGNPLCEGPIILVGDLNADPKSAVCQMLSRKLHDVQLEEGRSKPKHTWFGHMPFRRIDHVYFNKTFDVIDVVVPRTKLEKIASDHLPLIVDLKLKNV